MSSTPAAPNTKTTLTRAQWDAVKDHLSNPYAKLNIEADGHTLCITTVVNGNKLSRVVYIDGWLKGEYSTEGHPFNKFYYPKKIQYPSNAKIKKAKEGVSKKFIKQHPNLFTHSIKYFHMPFYSSVSAIKKRLEATCTIISINPESNADYGFRMPQ